tara:strand:- start:752 stop:1519 length:768 start_codon:yes stop_codon:yes gene_type:complete
MYIHENICNKLNNFLQNNSIPNILFNGPSGCGKKYIVNNFINDIYNNNKEDIEIYVLKVNCAKDGGIKFIREDIKYFCKTNIKNIFKTVVLYNADELTIDAQSALRRCIEIFNYNTRFFIVTNNKDKILKPILSRFCELNISYPIIKNNLVNLHKNKINKKKYNKDKEAWLQKYLNNIKIETLCESVELLYCKGYCAIDIVNIVQQNNTNLNINDLLLNFTKIKKEFRNEKLLMYLIIFFTYFRSNYDLENIVFI